MGSPRRRAASPRFREAALEFQDVLSFGFRQAAGLHRVLLGGRRATGIFDASPLGSLVGSGMQWRQLSKNLSSGTLKALVISATNVPTGRPVIFVDRAPGVDLPVMPRGQTTVRPVRIGPTHVLASAAIPLVFPPVRIGRQLHCDGGLRLNTPMAPAIHMGMERLFVIGVSNPDHAGQTLENNKYPGAPFLLGKVLNAFLLDHLNTDLAELERINSYLEDGIEAFGPDFLERLNEQSRLRGAPDKRVVKPLAIRPSSDLGTIAAAHLKKNRSRFGSTIGRTFLRLLDVGEGESDLASYLLFDGVFARELIELGRRDAAERRDEIEAFFWDA